MMNKRLIRTSAWLASLCLGLLAGGSLHAATGPLLSQQQLRLVPQQSVGALFAGRPGAPAPSTAMAYAHSAEVDWDAGRHGLWQQDAGRAVWRLAVSSADAVNLSLTLGDLRLPAEARLRIYDGDGFLWHGPYTASELTRHARFYTPVVPGERLLLELSVPAAQRPQTRLAVRRVHHGYRDIRPGAKSGSCNIDTACPAADDWTDAVRAAARITVGGRRLCSAVLLNNTRENGDPLLLTARHCGVGQSAEYPPSSVVVYWNYETSRCGGDPNGSLSQNQSGSTLLADGPGADFTLLRLDVAPPAHYQVYYAGWDATGQAPSSGVSVHHPSGDEKRISLFEDGARARTAMVDGEPVESWQLSWERGVTEAGSSGAGLWNGAHHVIGQLSGGNSSCDNPGGQDVFGRLDVAWQENPRIDGQLKAWLDPDDTGTRRLGGRDSSAGGLNANPDVFEGLPTDADTLRLDVLANDGGQQPLRLIDAAAGRGEVLIENGHLVYRFAPGTVEDELSYRVLDRWGETETVTVSVRRGLDLTATRGGALAPCLILLLLGAWRCRRN